MDQDAPNPALAAPVAPPTVVPPCAAAETISPRPVDPTPEPSSSSQSALSLMATEVTENLAALICADGPLPDESGRWTTPDPKPPTELGDFRLIRKLGEGAMGTVYKAFQISAEREVAVKVLFPHLARNPKLIERFYREARILGQLDHPNMVCGYAVGEEQGWHYFAMEYVDGRSLQKWLTFLGRFTVGDAVHVILACADALGYAHELDLVHRDIKPDNVLITRDGQVKVTDLGTVKLLSEDLSLTQTGNGIGTPCYMPLEQARNAKDSDGRSDIYALGCVLYCLLTGHPPFAGGTLVELIQAKDAAKFPPARKLNPAVPERLDLIIDKMVAKVLRYRYQSCAELVRDLQALGLANDSLSFIPGAGTSLTPTPLPERTPPAMPSPPAEDPEPDVWYVCQRTPRGPVTRKLTTAQILRLIQTKQLDLSAVASRSQKRGFRTLACYKDFEPSLFGTATRAGADRQTPRFRSLYQKIDEDDQERRRDRFREEGRSELPLVLFRIAAIAIGGGFVFVLLRLLINWATAYFGHAEL